MSTFQLINNMLFCPVMTDNEIIDDFGFFILSSVFSCFNLEKSAER